MVSIILLCKAHRWEYSLSADSCYFQRSATTLLESILASSHFCTA